MSNEIQTGKEEASFYGEFAHALDPKRRLTVPSVWRDEVGSAQSLVILPDYEQNCLTAVTREKARALFAPQTPSALFFDKRRVEIRRALSSKMQSVKFDVQGRILIDPKLLEFAGITGKTVMVGTFDRIQIWAAERYEANTAIDQEALREAFSELHSFENGN